LIDKRHDLLKLILSPVEAEKECIIPFRQNKSLYEAFMITRDGNGFKTRGYRDYKLVPARLMLNSYPQPLPATGSVCYPNPLPMGL
jgi:hypothetical protein